MAAVLAVVACGAACAIPIFIGAGVLTGTAAAMLEQTLLAVAALLGVAALGMWWYRRRQSGEASTGCGDGDCSC